MKRTVTMLALAALLVIPGAGMAQEEPPTYIWVNYMKAQPGQGDAMIKLTIEEDSKNLNPLVDSGSAYDWGLAMPVGPDQGGEIACQRHNIHVHLVDI